MEVSVSALRAELKLWIERARAGEDIVITDRGVPVARLSGVATADLITELTREGLLSPATEDRVLHTPPSRPGGPARPPKQSAMSGLVRRIRR